MLRFDQQIFSTKFVTTIGVDYRDKMVKVRRSTVSFVGQDDDGGLGRRTREGDDVVLYVLDGVVDE